MQILTKKVKKNRYMLAASLIVALCAAVRLYFIAHNWPLTNSDEGTVGLMALHIAHFKDFPVYLYGQGTLGSLEAYVGALLFPFFGPTVFALRFGLLLLFVCFLVSMYFMTSLLYTRKLALLTLVLLSLGSSDVLFRSYAAFAGHAETPLFGALLVLVAGKLALSSPASNDLPIGRRRLVGYGLWGCLVGAAFWNDPLAMAFALASGVFLLVFCRHELRPRVLLSMLAGLLIGLLPVILYNITVLNMDKSSLSVYGFLINYSDPVASNSVLAHFMASFLVALPTSTGAAPLCPLTPHTAWPISAQSSPQVLQCTAIHGAWALALVVLWLLAVIIAIRFLYPLWKKIPLKIAAGERRREAIIQGARLMLLGSAVPTFLVFTISVQSITEPWYNGRYLIGLGVVTPALLWPLWRAPGARFAFHWWKSLLVKTLCLSCIVFYAATMAIGTIQTSAQIPQVEAASQSHEALVSGLLRAHITHIYTDYWTCDLTAFLSQERIICSVLDEQLHPGVNRYASYVPIVSQDPHAAYVFQKDSPQNKMFALQIGRDASHRQYRVISMEDYLVYLP